jgi:hypothetical protein
LTSLSAPIAALFNPLASHRFFNLAGAIVVARRATEKAESRHDRNTKRRIVHL